ncbi:hypothetical protein LRAMOSA10840 [Lichtheimia ramosa]|uniref:DNA polymerase phi subunit n=1 Tax=Lichtheimia ramosa TaxID=688394 RepID=A0A077WQ47_9FUNG|nr:hypothetical protein LRAMOSA10840 [Lichtheimia ramosa]
MATTTMQLYWDLASIDPTVRQNASQTLIRVLADFQKDHESSLESRSNDLADTEEELDALCAADVSYAIRRLIRGLPSSRQGARQGFSLALTELLAVTNVIKVKLVLDLLFKYTERTGSMSGEETRDMLFGRLFGLMSIITAGMLTKPSTTFDDVERILESLKDICQAKSYLIEVSYHIVVQMLAAIKDVEYKDKAIAKIIELFLDEVETVDQLNLALAFQKQLPEVDLSNSFSNWKSNHVLATVNLPHLAAILKETSEEEQENQVEWKPQLHSVWDQLLNIYLEPVDQMNGHAEREESDRPKKKQRLSKKGDSKASKSDDEKASFEAFWSATVDGSLFENNASRGRKYWGFLLVQKVLPRLSAEQVPLIFTENFMRAFINNLSSDVRYLNKSAKYTANVIQKVANENKQVSFALVTQLLGKHGHQHFDRITKTKTVENLLATMDAEGVRSYLEYLARVFVQHEENDKVDSVRSWALRQMILLVKNPRVPKEEEWLGDFVRFLMVYAFFDVKKGATKGSWFESYRKPTPVLSDAIREECKKSFQSVLVTLSNMPSLAKVQEQQNGAVLKSRKFHGVRNDGELWVYHVLQIYQKLANDKSLVIHDELSDESKALFKKSSTLVEQLRKKATDPESLERGFEILFVHMMLHLLISEEEAQSLLEELFDCYKKISVTKAPKTKKKKNAEQEEAEPEPIDVLVDILVSFLTNPSPVLKDLAEKVFEIFSHKVTKQTLQNLLDILASNDKKHGSEDLFGADESDEEMDSDVEEIEMDSDVDMEEEDEDDDASVDEELRQKVEETMRQQGVLAGDDDDEENEELLDDDAMADFDDKLAEVFKQKHLEKKEKKDLQLSITQFKINVMDLVIIFVRKNPSSPMVLDLIVPLINIIRATPAKSITGQFVQKIIAFLKNRLPKMSEYPKEHDQQVIIDVYQAVYDFARSTSNSEMFDMCVQLSLYLRKCVLGAADAEITSDMPSKTRQEIEKLDAITITALEEYMTKKNTRYRKDIFVHPLQRSPFSSWPLLEALIQYINPAECINLFKHTQATQWITAVVQRTVAKKSQAYNDKFISIAPKIASKVQETLEASQDTASKNKLTYDNMRSFVRFVSTLVRLHKKLVNNDVKKLQKVWKPEWFSSITTVEAYNKPGLQTSCKQLVSVLEQ